MINHYTNHLKSLNAYNEYTQKRFESSVDFAIRKAEYHLMLLKGDCKKLFSKKYKDVAPLFLSKSSKKELLQLRLFSLFPWLIKVKNRKG